MTETNKLYSVAGVSKFNGQYKVRFANDIARVKLLHKNGNTDIELMDLPEPMTKSKIVEHLKTTNLMDNPEYRLAIDTADAKYNPVETVKVRKPKSSNTPSLEKIRARAATKDVTVEDILDVVKEEPQDTEA
jgi:hypothetical protein